MLNFYTRYLVRMNEYILTVGIVVVVFIVIIMIYRLTAGFYPGSKFILEDPPIAHNGLDPDKARFMLFFTTWCPWSVKARKAWDTFKQEMKNKPAKYGGKTIIFEEVDCESDKGKAALYKVKEYPTIKLETTDKLYILKAIPAVETFEEFLGVLGEKASS